MFTFTTIKNISYTGTHDVQDINITVHGEHVCVTCILADWATTNSCRVVLYSETTLTVKSLTLSTGLGLTTSTLTNCTEGIPRGHYHVKAYDTTNMIASNHAVMKYLYLDVAAPQGINIKTGTEKILLNCLYLTVVQQTTTMLIASTSFTTLSVVPSTTVLVEIESQLL